eukprot:351055-Chlamydomonas_euryale.AAC.3
MPAADRRAQPGRPPFRNQRNAPFPSSNRGGVPRRAATGTPANVPPALDNAPGLLAAAEACLAAGLRPRPPERRSFAARGGRQLLFYDTAATCALRPSRAPT